MQRHEITLNDVRAILFDRWPESLPLVDAIEGRTFEKAEYAEKVSIWLHGERSTVWLRDEICEPLRSLPEIVAIGKQFNPTTEWDNTWVPLDSAAHMARMRKMQMESTSEEEASMRALPYFGMF